MCITIIYGVKYEDIDLAEEHAYITQIQVDKNQLTSILKRLGRSTINLY